MVKKEIQSIKAPLSDEISNFLETIQKQSLLQELELLKEKRHKLKK